MQLQFAIILCLCSDTVDMLYFFKENQGYRHVDLGIVPFEIPVVKVAGNLVKL